MKCPKCGNEIEKNKCNVCNKTLFDIHLKLSEEAQVERNYEKALENLEKAKENAKNEEEKEDVDKLIRTIQFSRFEEKESQDIFEGIVSNSEDYEDNSRTKDYVYDGFKKLFFIALALIFLAGIGEYFRKQYYKNVKVANTVIDNRKLKVGLLFHLNQGHYPFSDIADKASYHRLIKTLRKHPKLKFNIHISGTLIQDLLWYNEETLQLIREGIEDGQFEILGSTYAQNVMYSTDEKSNRWQIERHKEIIKDVFAVEPVGFWNPERTWRQDLGKLMQEYGYKYTFVEDHILKRSGTKFSEYFLRTTDNGNLFIINDDFEFLPKFNSAIDAGDYEELRKDKAAKLSPEHKSYKNLFLYMREIYKKDKENKFLLNYAEDAEATGLWDLRDAHTPEYDFINLETLLTELEKKDWIELVKYSEYMKKENVKEDINPIVDGVATWMNKAAMGIGHYSERGYKNWFDFNETSPKLSHYRQEYMKYQEKIMKYETSENVAIRNLIDLAKEIYLSHQYEFGCTGISGTDEDWAYKRKYETWENVKLVNVVIDAIERIENYSEGIYEKDVNNDNIKEIVVVKNKNYYVFSKARGGRLLTWYDMATGIELVGGELGTNNNYPYYDNNILLPAFDFRHYVRFLAPEKDLLDYINSTEYYVRYKALNSMLGKRNSKDEIIEEKIYNYDMNYRITEDEQLLFETGDFSKEISFFEDGLEVSYEFSEDAEYLKIESEFQPDYLSIANKGKKVLDIEYLNQTNESKNSAEALLYNNYSDIGIKVEVFSQKKDTEKQKSFMGIILKNYIQNNGKLRISKYRK